VYNYSVISYSQHIFLFNKAVNLVTIGDT